jgi:hypothetical protein
MHSPWMGDIVDSGQPIWLDGPVRQPYAGVNFIPQYVRKAPLQVNFLYDDILHCLLWVLSFHALDIVEFSWPVSPGAHAE